MWNPNWIGHIIFLFAKSGNPVIFLSFDRYLLRLKPHVNESLIFHIFLLLSTFWIPLFMFLGISSFLNPVSQR